MSQKVSVFDKCRVLTQVFFYTTFVILAIHVNHI